MIRASSLLRRSKTPLKGLCSVIFSRSELRRGLSSIDISGKPFQFSCSFFRSISVYPLGSGRNGGCRSVLPAGAGKGKGRTILLFFLRANFQNSGKAGSSHSPPSPRCLPGDTSYFSDNQEI